MVFCKIASFHARLRSRSSQAAGPSGRRESSGPSIFKQTNVTHDGPVRILVIPKAIYSRCLVIF